MSASSNCLNDQSMAVHQRQRVVEALNVPAGQISSDNQDCRVGGDPNIRSGQIRVDGQGDHAAAEQSPHSANLQPITIDAAPSGVPICLDDQIDNANQAFRVVEAPSVPADHPPFAGTQCPNVGGDPIYIRSDHPCLGCHPPNVAAEQFPHSANGGADPNGPSPSGALNCLDDQDQPDGQCRCVVEVLTSPPTRRCLTSTFCPSAGTPFTSAAANGSPMARMQAPLRSSLPTRPWRPRLPSCRRRVGP
jgi:hypothetical protein